MKKILAACLLFTTGCGPDFVSKHGARVYLVDPNLSWTKEQIDAREDEFLQELRTAGRHDYAAMVLVGMNDSVVEVYAEQWQCSGWPGLCNGEQNLAVFKVWDQGCVRASSYTHELLHWTQQRFLLPVDILHSERSIWSIAESRPGQCD